MTQKHDGGPAYPGETVVRNGMHSTKRLNNSGMSLRDAAALAAIQGLCVGYWSQGGLDADDIATTANHIADAFIATRSGGET